MKHLLYFILAVLIVYLIGSLLMADFLWILHTGFLGWIGAIFIILWFFLQIEKEYGGWNEEDVGDDQYISKKEARKIAEDVCKEMFNIKENKFLPDSNK